MNEDKYDEIIIVEPYKKQKQKGNKIKKGMAVTTAVALTISVFSVGYGLGAREKIQTIATTVAQEGAPSQTVELLDYTNSSGKETATSQMIRNIAPAVVSIHTNQYTRVRGFYTTQESAGSGIIIHEDQDFLYIVTNQHVIDNANDISVSFDDNKLIDAKYVGADSSSDIAVIRVSKTLLTEEDVQNYKLAVFGDSDQLLVGEDVVAIGNAAGEGKSATKGIISALDKKINIDGKNLEVIQTDAAINPGNSGGALVDMKGNIIGVNTAKFSSLGIEGMGYSIPSNNVKQIVEQILADGVDNAERPFLGIEGITVTSDLSRQYQVPKGVYIQNILAQSNAQMANLISGDIICKVNGQEILTSDDLSKAMEKTTVGDKIVLDVYRQGTMIKVNVILS